MKRPRRTGRETGFTYVGALIVVAIMAMAATTTLRFGAVIQRRAAEEELLAIGGEFRDALISYANASAPGQPRSPLTLDALLKDARQPTVRRHLRRIYRDPMTGSDQWGLVQAQPGPGIMGVHSLAETPPIKQGNFDVRFKHFEGTTAYSQWVFSPPPEAVTGRPIGVAR